MIKIMKHILEYRCRTCINIDIIQPLKTYHITKNRAIRPFLQIENGGLYVQRYPVARGARHLKVSKESGAATRPQWLQSINVMWAYLKMFFFYLFLCGK